MLIKKFSPRALSTLSLSIALATGAVMPLQGIAQTRQDEIQLAADAPDRHVVVKGDTLWGIAGLFLKEPWRWPEIWQLNKAEIKNPHLIYPGDIVYLDRSGDTPRLRLGRNVYGGSHRAGSQGPTGTGAKRTRARGAGAATGGRLPKVLGCRRKVGVFWIMGSRFDVRGVDLPKVQPAAERAGPGSRPSGSGSATAERRSV